MTAAIDFSHLERYVCGDSALRAEVLELFVAEGANIMSRFQAEQDDEAWRDAAHALKGLARGVGAWTLGDLAEQAEGLVGEVRGKAELRRKLLDELRRASAAAFEAAGDCCVAATRSA